MEEIASKYDPRAVEDRWYAYWMEHRFTPSLTLANRSQ